MNPIVLIRFSSIGDILLCEPLPRLLKQKEPHRPVIFVTKSCFREIPEGWPYVDQVYSLDTEKDALKILASDLSRLEPEAVYDLHNTLRSRRLLGMCRFPSETSVKRLGKHRLFKLALVHGKPFLKFMQEPPPVARRLLSLADLDHEDPTLCHPRLVVNKETLFKKEEAFHLLAPGAGRWTKSWPDEYWKDLTRGLLAESDYPIAVAGGVEEMPLAENLVSLNPDRVSSFAGKLSLSESATLVSQAKNIVVGDTGLMHMADAAGIPGVVLFGGTVPALGFPPLNGTLQVLERQMSCRPCHHFGRHDCPQSHFHCMRNLLPGEVLNILLETVPKPPSTPENAIS